MMKGIEGWLFLLVVVLFVYHAAKLPWHIVSLIGWLYKHNFWFRNTLAEIREEEIGELESTNNKIDLFIFETEKRSLGIFRRS